MNMALLAGLTSGALWGFAFVVPRILEALPSGLIALGRFTFFSLFSWSVLFLQRKKISRPFLQKHLKKALILAFMGNSFYYFLLVMGVQLAGITAPSLIVGLLPVTIAVAGNHWRINKKMIPSLSLISLGILVIHWNLFSISTSDASKSALGLLDSGHWQQGALGIACSVSALCLWTWYAIENSRYLQRHKEIPLQLWSSLTGALTLFFSPLLAAAQLFWQNPHHEIFSAFKNIPSWSSYLFWSAVLGIGSSWLALWLWNLASRRLPTSLAGQLIVSETVFALLYGFIYENRGPNWSEGTSMILMITGVIWALRQYKSE